MGPMRRKRLKIADENKRKVGIRETTMLSSWIWVVALWVIFLTPSIMTLHFFSDRKKPNRPVNMTSVHVCLARSGCDHIQQPRPARPAHRSAEGGREAGSPGRYLMLVPKVAVQFLRVLGLVVAELAFVRFQFIVLFYVLLEALVTGAGEGTLIAAEDHSLQVLGQLGPAHLNGDHALFCGERVNGKMGIVTDGNMRGNSPLQLATSYDFQPVNRTHRRPSPPSSERTYSSTQTVFPETKNSLCITIRNGLQAGVGRLDGAC